MNAIFTIEVVMDSKQHLLDQILGLGPVMPVLVIDRIEEKPTEN